MYSSKRILKVLQLGAYPPPWGGVQHNIYAIHQYLLKRNAPGEVINLTRHRTARDSRVHNPANWIEVLWLLLRRKYDVVHLHFGGSLAPRLLALALVCALLPGRKAVLTFHSGGYPTSDEGRTARERSIRGFVFRRFDAIIGVNEEIVRLFRRFGVAPDRVRLICPYVLVDQESRQPLPKTLEDFFAAHEPVLLTVAGLEPEYDIPIQIEAVGLLQEKYPKIGLMIVGSGSLEGEMKALINTKPYAGRIVLCGDLPHDLTLRAMKESSLFLRTTTYDGDSIAVREALQVGVQVIATDNHMRPEGVQLIPLSDLKALVQAIERCLDDPLPRTPRGEQGEDNIGAVIRLYEELTGKESEATG